METGEEKFWNRIKRKSGLRAKDAIAASLLILFLAAGMMCHCPFLFALAGIAAVLGWSKGSRKERIVIALLAGISLACTVLAFIA
jgi:4-amino-4-deoxy-L-arabinose transferase-like glycosyltransferase